MTAMLSDFFNAIEEQNPLQCAKCKSTEHYLEGCQDPRLLSLSCIHCHECEEYVIKSYDVCKLSFKQKGRENWRYIFFNLELIEEGHSGYYFFYGIREEPSMFIDNRKKGDLTYDGYKRYVKTNNQEKK